MSLNDLDYLIQFPPDALSPENFRINTNQFARVIVKCWGRAQSVGRFTGHGPDAAEPPTGDALPAVGTQHNSPTVQLTAMPGDTAEFQPPH